jgi:hypothetical protein
METQVSLFSGICRRVNWQFVTNISEKIAASIFGVGEEEEFVGNICCIILVSLTMEGARPSETLINYEST